jgi:hypothetical protein
MNHLFRVLVLSTLVSVGFISTLPRLVQACSPDGREGLLPENKMRIGVDALVVSSIDQATYNAVIDKVEAVYAPITAALGGKLEIDRKWSDPIVNSYAWRLSGVWHVDILGGLARYPGLTPDSLALVVCHELGHHLGGAPRFWGVWAAVEGEADYFAAFKCMKMVFDQDEAPVDPTVPATVTQKCRETYAASNEVRVCERTAMAGLALGDLLAVLGRGALPHFDTPDLSKVSRTEWWHPIAQCRLDTYVAGAFCATDPSVKMGGPDGNDPTISACSMEKGDTIGFRPLCWYKPKTNASLSF